MFLVDVITLAVGTLIVLVLIHLTVFWVSKNMTQQQPQVVYVQAPQQPTFVQPPVETQQVANVPTMDPQFQMPPTIELPKRHGE
jgi:hypothetical protein